MSNQWIIKCITKSMVLETLEIIWKNMKVDLFFFVLNIIMNFKCITYLYGNNKIKA